MIEEQAVDLSKRLGNFPFVTMGPASRHWQGIEAAIYRLCVPKDFPISQVSVYWPQITLVIHLDERPNRLTAHSGKRSRQVLSQRGSIHLTTAPTPRRLTWTEPATNLMLSIRHDFIQSVAGESMKGDPAHCLAWPEGHMRDALAAHIGFSIAALLGDSPADTRLYGESLGVALVHHLLYHHARRSPASRAPDRLANPTLNRALDYLHAHVEESLSLQELAEQAGVSVAHFSRLFRQATGQSPYQYVVRLRCERARDLLGTGRYTVTEAAHAVGFFDHSHFIRHFKRLYRMTPHEWRLRK